MRAQTFTFRAATGAPGSGPIAGAVNLTVDAAGRPRLSLVLDTAGHGTHVAGISAGHDLYGVDGFDGVAPGAQVIGLKIADDARGGLSTTGSMIRAMEYAVRFAAERGVDLAALPLADLQRFCAQITDDVFPVLTLEGSLAARNHVGGTAPAQVRAAVARARRELAG